VKEGLGHYYQQDGGEERGWVCRHTLGRGKRKKDMAIKSEDCSSQRTVRLFVHALCEMRLLF